MTIAVISASIGDFDTPKLFPEQDIECDYYYFTETPTPFHSSDSRLKAKYFKMLAHEIMPHDILVWVDGNVQIKTSSFIREFINEMGNADVCLAKHPFRDSVYNEADFIASEIDKGNKYFLQRYSKESILQEVGSMRKDIKGLYWCGLFARRNNTKVNAAFCDWFLENVLWTNFDQNNFVKIVYKHNLKINTIDWGEFYNNNSYILSKHK